MALTKPIPERIAVTMFTASLSITLLSTMPPPALSCPGSGRLAAY